MTNAALLDRPKCSNGVDFEPDLIPCIVSIAKTIRQLVSLNLSECGVEPGQDQFLRCLADHGGLSVAQVADRLSVRASTVSKMADHLCRKEWVIRCADASDQRRVRIQLTEEGRAVAEIVLRIQQRMGREVWTTLGTNTTLMPNLMELDRVLAHRLRRLR